MSPSVRYSYGVKSELAEDGCKTQTDLGSASIRLKEPV